MEESKLLREGGEVSDDIFNDPIFKDPSQRLIIPKHNNLNLSNLTNLGMKRLSNLITSAIQRKNNRAISNNLNKIDPSILAINILPTMLSKLNFSQKQEKY